MAKHHWDSLSRRLHTYEQSKSISRLLEWPRDRGTRVDVFVPLRAIVIVALVWMAHPFPSVASWIAIGIAAYTFADVMLVVTAQAFFPTPPMKNPLRYVVLTLIGFATLAPWFAIFLAPVASSFDPALTERSAVRTAWAAVTASAVISGERHGGVGSSVVLAAATMTSLYYLVVVLVAAVARATQTPERRRRSLLAIRLRQRGRTRR